MSNSRTREKIRLIASSRLIAVLLFSLLLCLTGTACAGPSRLQQSLVVNTQDQRDVCLRVELANDPESRRQGLMHRRQLADDAGMLFDYRRQQQVQMWMKNTWIPLDMLFIDEEGRIVHIVTNTQPHSTAIIDSGKPVRAVLEVNAGVAASHDIRRGDRVRHAIFGNPGQSDCAVDASEPANRSRSRP